ncbi:MAG: hypothetical protein GX774_11265 [Armatimonadetes bacterium]|nr:hypothetical protein [Armatimonadota bacterium]
MLRVFHGGRLVAALLLLAAAGAQATPTTNIWNPSTDVQAPGVLHLGIDNYFSLFQNATNQVAFPTDIGLTYGLGGGFEVGIDLLEPSANPFVFNAKWGLPERGATPALALGIQAVGTTRATQGNIAYALVAKSFGSIGRLTLGGYTGRESFLGEDNAGVIAAWDRSFGKRWWASIDYASGNNAYGALALGAAYRFTPRISLLFGYVIFNDSSINPNDTFTTQVDIDL